MARELDTEAAAGGDPTEERGPSDAESTPAECEIRPGEHDAPPEGSQAEFVSELDEAYVPDLELCVPHPLDGLPAPVGEGGPMSTAPAFTFENVVCVEDDRAYVEMWRDEVEAYQAPGVAEYDRGRLVELARRRYDAYGEKRSRAVFSPENVQSAWGMFLSKSTGQPVRPVRERCKHYRCQLMNNDEVPDPNEYGHKIVFRNCAARRSVGGALMSVRDQAIYACDYRDPPDEKSAKEFDETQRARLRSGAHETLVPFLHLKPKGPENG
jgi:hypothetical protein